MVSADNVNYDVWELVFAYLNGPDLAAVTSVSRSFWACALPLLYRTLPFQNAQAKGYPRVKTPFAVLRSRPSYAIFARIVDIRAVPLSNPRAQKAGPELGFLADAHFAVASALNLTSFTCTAPSAIPSFLVPLQKKERLQHLRIHADLTVDMASELVKIDHLRSLVLDRASCWVLDVLPQWAEAMKNTLRQLTIFSSPVANPCVLAQTVERLPKLLGLHVVQCPNIPHAEVFALADHTPKLQSLACTVIGSSRSLPQVSFTELKHLALDIPGRCPPTSPLPTPITIPHSLTNILPLTRFTHLSSLAVFSNISEPLDDSALDGLLHVHGPSLRCLRLQGVSLDPDDIRNIAAQCTNLEKLLVPIPVDDMDEFIGALSHSESLRTLVDASVNGAHSHRVSLTNEPVRDLMGEVESLRRVISQNRFWTVRYLLSIVNLLP
ncbi:hypothetical protein K488DRAFT_56674 [Vararia minispora EC-137]|uniref:Uncharacterized protein n=1 Tax=Vararia minispora EC-137 TaxID=1314806 RepID=A0ACB8QC67_9AGAM|nr:hypothetical protein K488DRAFT_56674 [Vararia minispora EC-137]